MIFMATWCGGIATIQNVLDLLFTWLYYDYMITNTEQKMKHTRLAVCILFAASLAACGGGGGGSTPVVTPPVAAAPTATVTLSTVKAKAGDNVVVTWSSTDATSCVGSDALSTSATSGTSAVSAAVGQTKFTLTCTGPGGNKVASATLGVPLPVKATSYANAKENGVGSENIPDVATKGYTVLAYAFADFQQNGTMSLVTHSLEYDVTKPETKTAVGHVAFWSKNTTGGWTDITSKLLANTGGCLHARKAVVADYNGDGKPDVFFACTGFDANPFTGEKQMVLISQADGTYKNEVLPVTCYCHGASAAELNSAGYADIVVTDIATNTGSFMLMNNKDGTFTKDNSALPAVVRGKAIFTAELLDYNHDGKVDLFLAGIEQDSAASFTPTVFYNNGANVFNAGAKVLASDNVYTTTLDIVVDGNNTYLLRTPSDYMGTSIQKINGDNVTTSFANNGYLNKDKNLVWVDWITIIGDKVVSMNAMYGVAVGK